MQSKFSNLLNIERPSVIKDAARQSDVERERFMEMQRQFEVKRRELVDLESGLRAKEAELERLKDHAFAREVRLVKYALHSRFWFPFFFQKSADAATKTTGVLQQKLRSKLDILQQHSRDLLQREHNVSAQKLELSKERLELQSIRRKLYQSRCSLCKIGDRSKEITDLLTNSDTKPDHSFQVPNNIDAIAEEPFKELTNFDEMIDAELAQSLENMHDFKSFEIDLNDIPNLTNTSDHLLDADLLMLKFDALRTSNYL